MSKQSLETCTISVGDVVHTLRECERDWKYSGGFEHILAFASELTGLSEDVLAEMMYRDRGIEGVLAAAQERSGASGVDECGKDKNIEKE